MQIALHTAGALWIAFYLLAALTAAGHALLHKRDPRSAWGWITVCWLFPLGGSALYWLFGVNRMGSHVLDHPYHARPRVAASALPPAIRSSQSYRELARAGEMVGGNALLRGNRIDPLYNGEQAYPAMLEMIAGARESIYLATYIFLNDETGHRFAIALANAVSRGVRVRVLLDGASDFYYRPRGSRMLQRLGVPCRSFLPLRLWPPMWHANLRNHRKLLLVDGNVACTGGMNIAHYHLLEGGAAHPVADLHFRIRGPLVDQLEATFRADWGFVTAEALPSSSPCAASGIATCRAITDGPDNPSDPFMLVLIAALATAHRSVCIMTPYFLPPAPITAALEATALRGIDVRILLPGASDQPWIDWATRHALLPLLLHQVRLYFGPAPFAHTKLLLIDDEYVQFGSANLDVRSMRLNFELNVEAYDHGLTAELHRHFDAQIHKARRIDQAELISLPLVKRLRNACFWLFSPYL
jgi:cardiolipin synthase